GAVAAVARPPAIAANANASSHTMNVRARGQSDMSVDVLKRSVILDHLTRERRGLDFRPAPSRCDAGQYQASRERQARNALLVRQVTRLVRLDRHHAAH